MKNREMVSLRPASKHELNSALIGMIIGDGSMQKTQTKGILYLRHGGKQLSYVDEKINYLSEYIKPISVKQSKDNKGYDYKYAYFNNQSLLDIYNDMYINDKKRLSSKILNRITSISLAFIYMDDGCLSLRKCRNKDGKWTGGYKSREIHLNIQSFTWEEAKNFQKLLKNKFKVEFSLTTDKGNPRLWCNTRNTKLFLELVKPIVKYFPTMLYKLDLKYKNNVTINHPNGMKV